MLVAVIKGHTSATNVWITNHEACRYKSKYSDMTSASLLWSVNVPVGISPFCHCHCRRGRRRSQREMEPNGGELDSIGSLFIYRSLSLSLLIKKFTVVWLLSLFVWNVALAGVPSLLLCWHDDFEVHLESEDACDRHCDSAHLESAAEHVVVCEINENCTDIELLGGEQLPTRLNDSYVVELPVFVAVESAVVFPKVPTVAVNAQLGAPARAPPPAHWLTDVYIKKTVLRV